MTAHHPPLSERNYLFPSEVADILGVSHSTVNRYVRAGLLGRRHTLGGHGRYDKATVEHLRDRLTVAVTGGAR